jgi:hypothetical protein
MRVCTACTLTARSDIQQCLSSLLYPHCGQPVRSNVHRCVRFRVTLADAIGTECCVGPTMAFASHSSWCWPSFPWWRCRTRAQTRSSTICSRPSFPFSRPCQPSASADVPPPYPHGWRSARFEVIVGVLAEGLIWTSTSYLRRSHENRFDVLVVLCFWADFTLWRYGITYIRFLPALYALRSFKLLLAYGGTKVRRRDADPMRYRGPLTIARAHSGWSWPFSRRCRCCSTSYSSCCFSCCSSPSLACARTKGPSAASAHCPAVRAHRHTTRSSTRLQTDLSPPGMHVRVQASRPPHKSLAAHTIVAQATSCRLSRPPATQSRSRRMRALPTRPVTYVLSARSLIVGARD